MIVVNTSKINMLIIVLFVEVCSCKAVIAARWVFDKDDVILKGEDRQKRDQAYYNSGYIRVICTKK